MKLIKPFDMKLVKLLICVFFTPLAVFAQTPAELGVAAIGYVVSDIEASEKFYTEIVGMTPAGGFSLDEQWSDDAGAANGKPFSVKLFKLVDSPTATVLKLAYFDSMEPRPAQQGIDEFAGVNYLTLYYDAEGFSAAVARVQEAEIEMTGWVKRETYQLFFIKDPDGVFVEIVGPPD